MKFIALISADLDRSPLGTRSRLADELSGRPILRRAVERVLRVDGLAAVHVLAPAAQAERLRPLLNGLNVVLETHDGTSPPYAALVRAGRWWGLDGWRGGIGGLCVFDEDIHVAAAGALLQRTGADALLAVPAAAPLVDPALLDALLRHHEEYAESSRITIVQAPPGLAAIVLNRIVLDELAPLRLPPGALLTYSPDRPMADLAGREACYRPAAEVIEARGRLLADTRRGFDRLRELFSAGGEAWDAARIGRWLLDRAESHVELAPEEIEIELTTDDPSPNHLLRPRGGAVPRRGPLDMEIVRAVAGAIAEYDDVRVVLGGFGEPCRHPQFADICNVLRDSSAATIAVRTSAMVDDPAVERALFETPVDVVEVTLDAATRETYRRVAGVDAFDDVSARLERWLQRRAAGQSVRPLIVPSFVKSAENVHEMEAFFDGWQRRLGMALITGYSHRAGQRNSLAVTSTAPPRRGLCRRVFSRAMILADGRMTTCDQDFTGRQAIGRLKEKGFAELWQGALLGQIRTHHSPDLPLCPKCDEWHRP